MGRAAPPSTTRLRWSGAWDASIAYIANDQVSNDGDLFVCILAHTSAAGNEPGTGVSWTTYWVRSVDMLTAEQVSALDGTSGIAPSGTNKFVDNADTRNTNARTPTSHGADKHSQTLVETGDSRLSDARTPTSHSNTYHSETYATTANTGLVRIYANITAAKAATSVDGLIGYVQSLDNFYRGLAAGSAYTADDTFVLITGDAGNTRWVGVGPRYVADGNIPREIVQAATDPLTAAECSGTIINNYGQGAANTQTLPTAAPGLSFVFVCVTTGMGAVNFKAGASDKICLAGTWLDDGDKVSLATPAAGDSAAFICVTTGAGAYDWVCNTIKGTWTDGGA